MGVWESVCVCGTDEIPFQSCRKSVPSTNYEFWSLNYLGIFLEPIVLDGSRGVVVEEVLVLIVKQQFVR